MNFEVIISDIFRKELKKLSKKYVSIKSDYQKLIESLEINPTQGTPIGNNCYKIRLAIKSKGKGKRGGSRVITYVVNENKEVILLTIYDKKEKADLEPNELDSPSKIN